MSIYSSQQVMLGTTSVFLMQSPHRQPINEYMASLERGDLAGAWSQYYALKPLRDLWSSIYAVLWNQEAALHPIATIKYWMDLMGMRGGTVRPPLVAAHRSAEGCVPGPPRGHRLVPEAPRAGPALKESGRTGMTDEPLVLAEPSGPSAVPDPEPAVAGERHERGAARTVRRGPGPGPYGRFGARGGGAGRRSRLFGGVRHGQARRRRRRASRPPRRSITTTGAWSNAGCRSGTSEGGDIAQVHGGTHGGRGRAAYLCDLTYVAEDTRIQYVAMRAGGGLIRPPGRWRWAPSAPRSSGFSRRRRSAVRSRRAGGGRTARCPAPSWRTWWARWR